MLDKFRWVDKDRYRIHIYILFYCSRFIMPAKKKKHQKLPNTFLTQPRSFKIHEIMKKISEPICIIYFLINIDAIYTVLFFPGVAKMKYEAT